MGSPSVWARVPLLAVGRFLVLTEGDAEHGEAQEEVGDPDPSPDEAKLQGALLQVDPEGADGGGPSSGSTRNSRCSLRLLLRFSRPRTGRSPRG